jgi:streptomycin 6-kinase
MKKPIAFGRRSSIFSQKNGKILKLYDKDFPIEKVHAEYMKACAIWKSNLLKVPEPIKEVTKYGKHGIIFEKIEGIALIDLFQKKPWLYFKNTKIIAGIHKSIHKISLSNIPSQQEEFTDLISKSNRLNSIDKINLLKILHAEYNPVLCHGDFHHGNLIQARSGVIYIIDWMDAFIGSNKLDVALTAVNAMVSDSPDHVPVFYRNSYELLKRVVRLDKKYIKAYGLDNYQDYMFLAAGIHLARGDDSKIANHKKYFTNLSSQY